MHPVRSELPACTVVAADLPPENASVDQPEREGDLNKRSLPCKDTQR